MAVTLWSGLTLGAVYATVALGFTISLLPSGVFNFAQGAIVAAAVYLTSTLLDAAGGGVPLAVVALGDAAAGAALGVACELVCVRPLRGGAPLGGGHRALLATIGLSTVAVGAIGLLWGPVPRAVPFPVGVGPVRALGVVARPEQLVLVGGAAVAAAALQLWSRRSRTGLACLAVAEDRSAAALRGIDVERLSLAGFAAAGAFGGLSAVVIGPITYAVPDLSFTLALGGFVAIALGGHGSFAGCLLGGLLAGVVSALASRYAGAAYADPAVLALLVATLAARPAGVGAFAIVRDV